MENCKMDEMVHFSYKATHDIDPGSNHIGMDSGEQLPMEDCLKAILIRSANEVSFAVAEHIAGDTWENFAPIMNERAKELGCLNSNFVNPNGLPNENHVTTAYDLAMIGRAFFDNELLCQMTLTKQLHLYPTDVQPDEIWENNHMLLLPGKEYAYEPLVGCKTGYTNAARSSLVSCAEKNGLKLICVVLQDEAPYQYEDTIALFEYGFNNFEKRNISENETRYNLSNSTPFYSEEDIFGSSQSILFLNNEDYVVVPKNADFQDLETTISYSAGDPTEVATITYAYHGVQVGTAAIHYNPSSQTDYTFEADTSASSDKVTSDTEVPTEAPSDSNKEQETPSFFFINAKKILIVLGCVAGLVLIILLIRLFFRNYQINLPGRTRRLPSRKKRRKKLYGDDLSADLKRQRKQQIQDAKRRQKRARRH
jgi:D-alanyl-D-alanine carboxypeptidase